MAETSGQARLGSTGEDLNGESFFAEKLLQFLDPGAFRRVLQQIRARIGKCNNCGPCTVVPAAISPRGCGTSVLAWIILLFAMAFIAPPLRLKAGDRWKMALVSDWPRQMDAITLGDRQARPPAGWRM